MALGDNGIVPLLEPADDFTGAVTAAVTAGRFLKPSGSYQGGPLLDVTSPTSPLTKGNLPQVAPCGAGGGNAIGVSKWDAPSVDDVVGIASGNKVVPMVADGAVTAGDIIMSGATGGAKTWVSAASDANHELGVAMSTAVDGATVYVKINL
jgi:hypothetical protein